MSTQLSIFYPLRLGISLRSSLLSSFEYFELQGVNHRKLVTLDDKYYTLKQAEEKYCDALNLPDMTNIPRRIRLNSFSTPLYGYLVFRPTGLSGLLVELTFSSAIDAGKIKESIQRITREIQSLGLGNLAKSIRQIVKKNLRSAQTAMQVHDLRSIAFGKPVTTIIGMYKTDHELEHSKGEIKELIIRGGSQGSLEERQKPNGYRASSRAIHAHLTSDYLGKKGRVLFRASISLAIQIAYCSQEILHQLFSIPSESAVDLDYHDWIVLLHFINPYVIGGKTMGDTPLSSGLQRSWYLMASDKLDLRNTYYNLMSKIVNQPNLKIDQLIYLAHNINKIIPKKQKIHSVSLGYHNHERLSGMEEQIIKYLKKRHEEEISGLNKDNKPLNFKYGTGCTKSELTVELFGYSTGAKNSDTEKLLNGLHKKGLIDIRPFSGAGRGTNKIKYQISPNLTKIRESLLAAMTDRFVI